MIYNNITETIGKTPLVKLNKISEGLYANIYVKLENNNPGGSVKDRLALAMIENAEKEGLINTDTEIIEATSGNTGIGLAMICAVKGYKLTIVMPESMSMERRNLLQAYGVNLVLTSAAKGMQASIDKANELHKSNKNSYLTKQFENTSNAEIHRKTTAVEIWEDTNNKVDMFVAGVGTGGTFTGVSSKLKELNPKIKCVAVEPTQSPIISQAKAGVHKIQGIGAGFIPKNLDVNLIDEIITIENDEAFEVARQTVKQEGILCGISSGANIAAAIKLASQEKNKAKNIITIIADTGERYLSTSLFNTTENE